MRKRNTEDRKTKQIKLWHVSDMGVRLKGVENDKEMRLINNGKGVLEKLTFIVFASQSS